ncbi:Transcriptional regulatory protein QseF [Brevundimonas sp. NIBR10]|uniref:response regulator n=1 Tax=Brevundimonas sp. NIBR10 TaxID=3015997 RepID=UPI0022F1D622|nr:response regulator [Brevundimonas sp. NIBR10]WGM47148.1 Transcriptional regulatory protein QseF [Brevundimonas sp. NIBR10]
MATILIADDDPIVREIACEMLRSTDHAAVMAEDGLEVLKLLSALHVDLLITDMLMPKMDGVEVMMEARIKHPSLKILAISGGGSVGADYILHTAKVLGADAVLKKPLRLNTFLETVDDLLYDRVRGRIGRPRERVTSGVTAGPASEPSPTPA